MTKLFWTIWWKLTGWKLSGNFPMDEKKMIILVAPHTSWIDIIVGLAVRHKLKIFQAKFLGKKELFDGPFGWYFKWLGGVPVDRFSKQGMVEQVSDMFNYNKKFIIALSPEGTRKKVTKLKTGFYHIAKQANVPIQLIGFDFKNKKVEIGNLFYPSNDEVKDFKNIIDFFGPIKGAIPEKGLSHLLDNY